MPEKDTVAAPRRWIITGFRRIKLGDRLYRTTSFGEIIAQWNRVIVDVAQVAFFSLMFLPAIFDAVGKKM